MPIYKDEKKGTWYVMVRYTDWQGARKQKCKRGFSTKREAQNWERQFSMQSSGNTDMTFEAFLELYENDMRQRLKESTWDTKKNIIETKILPYFGNKRMNEITTKDIIAWQNEMLAYRNQKQEPYSPVYLKTPHNQLSAILNHAVRFYDLGCNPAAKAGNMGSEKHKEMLIWTTEEYKKFAEIIMDKPLSYYAFEILYWGGLREGEMLALTPADLDFENGTIRVNKTYKRKNRRDIVTTPKTDKSNRIISMPKFLAEELQDCLKMLYGIKKTDRIFTGISVHCLYREMERGAKKAGVKRIRIHDLRHSHASLLINLGFSAVAIADRMGHENVEVTYMYAHLFPSKQGEIAAQLHDLGKGDFE